jgi:hypothetical protein
MDGVSEHIIRDRIRRIRERTFRSRVRTYHSRILHENELHSTSAGNLSYMSENEALYGSRSATSFGW